MNTRIFVGPIALAMVLLCGCSRHAAQSEGAVSSESVLRMKAQCAEVGKRARDEWVMKYDHETFSDSPEYGYSAALNTCLYADEYTDVNPGARVPLLSGTKSRRDRFVLDVYSDKVLAEYTEHDGKPITTNPDPVMCRTEPEFEARKAMLFGSVSR
jgi:hypothetical protein